MTRMEPLRFTNCRGESLAAILHHPVQPRGASAVVVAHGMLSSKESPKHTAICTCAAASGRPALRFDFAGRGESEGDPELLTVSREVEDLHAAIDVLRERTTAPITVVGSSLGGSVAILTSASRADVAGLVTIASPARLPSSPRKAWGGELAADQADRVEVAVGTFISNEFFSDAALHDVISAAQRCPIPWLILHGARDEVVPVQNAHELLAARDSASLVVHPEADHRFSTPDMQTWLMAHVEGYLKERQLHRGASRA